MKNRMSNIFCCITIKILRNTAIIDWNQDLDITKKQYDTAIKLSENAIEF